MDVSRREFLKLCGISAAVLGLTATDMGHLEEALANPNGPTVLWLQGSACTGCSVSFLNRVSTTDPKSAGDVLISGINLKYHPNVMSLAGDSAVAVAEEAYNSGNYILVVEGGVPTAFDGAACLAWSYNGEDVTFQQAVTDLASRAAKVICVGACAGWGGIPASGPNPTGVKGVQAATGVETINIPGCPAHPDWIVWAIAQLLMNQPIELDYKGRPATIFTDTVHSQCPRRTGQPGQDGPCLAPLGCLGPDTVSPCPVQKWNGGTAWCVENNAPCIGCVDPNFPRPMPFYQNIPPKAVRPGESDNSHDSHESDD